jgi:hypothetical protein
MTLVWTPTSNWTSYTYSWSQAEAAGAGAERTASSKQQTALARNS